MEYAKLILKPKKEHSLLRKHPWVFSGAVDRAEGKLVEGDIAIIEDSRGNFLGMGHIGGGSIIARIFSFEKTTIDSGFWNDKISRAWELRKDLGFPNESTNMFRLIHGEGDGIPGLIVDVYDKIAVMQCHSIGIHVHKEELAHAIIAQCGGTIVGVYDKSAETLAKVGYNEAENGMLVGDQNSACIAHEHNMKFNVDWENGQKTGFFIDQRENRKLLGEMSKGKKVLNTFCYTGGFSIYALANEAVLVHSLDSSQKALDLTDENVKLNGFEKGHRSVKADAVEYLKDLEEDYDIIVLDPPAFAKHQKARHAAVQAYKRINAHAIRQIKPGGKVFTFSCSQAVDKELFNSTVRAAAIEAGRNVRVLHQLHQPADHPINIFHPEGEYLKGLVLQVD